MPTSTPEWICQQIVNNAPEAIIFADRAGRIRLWNNGAEAMFGSAAQEAVGQNLDLIIPERQRGRHWEGYHKVMATGVTRYGKELLAVPAARKDGSRLSLEFSVVLLRDEANQPIGIAAIMHDVTVRWQQDRALKERLAAVETKQETGKQ